MKTCACAALAFILSSQLFAESPAKYSPSADELREAYQRAAQVRTDTRVYKLRITPHWFADNQRFWYRNDLKGGAKEFIVVDAEKGKREPAFDHAKLAAGLSKAAGKEYRADRLPFDEIEFPGESSVQFRVGWADWKCDLKSYECVKAQTPAKEAEPNREKQEQASCEADDLFPSFDESDEFTVLQPPAERAREFRSPDRKFTAFVKDNNVFLRSGGDDVQLSTTGTPGNGFEIFAWSPDSKALVAARVEPGERKEVYTIESSPRGGGRAKLNTRPYPLPGDKFTAFELWVFDPENKKATKVEAERVDFGRPVPRWHKDGRHFTYWKTDRGHQRFRVIEVDAHTGKTRSIIDDKSNTFVWTAHGARPFLRSADHSDEIIFGSERDGWHHLYLVDTKTGTVKNQITQGAWVVRGIERVDEEKRQIWFRACGKNPKQDPYFIHYYRVNFDGSGLVALTEANGTHTVQFSPDNQYIIDTWSRVDAAPVHGLRRCADGKFVCGLEKADASELAASGWKPPEVFVAKGRDGTTDIWGIICRPPNLDAEKKYPVIEYVYAGPHDSFVPKAFMPNRTFRSLTELGFIVVQMDGMGTANRSKAFHDVCWHNLKDAGFPDRILWHQAAAKKYPYYDTSRVGIYGTSAGGQSSTGALLFHGDFYKAAVSACGCHDNRMDKASWNEQWMGYPVGPHYAECSNIDNARKLRGKLLLIVGELDTNVPPESTYRLVDALVKAGKDFDLLVVPGMGHSDGGPYGRRRLQDFFVRHLHGIDSPERNATQ